MATLNPEFSTKIQRFGAVNINACYNCGNCTAICPLSEPDNSFPRKMLRVSVLGLEDKLAASTEPWLCYYCGECSETCPRDANPGELMMSLRRYLTSLYDWTGISGKFYSSKWLQIGAAALVSVITLVLFVIFGGPMITDAAYVKLNSFAPVNVIKTIDFCLVVFVSFMIISYLLNMYFKILGSHKELKIPLVLYFKEFWLLIVHFASQWRFSKCSDRKYWFVHWLVMTGYVMMFGLIVVFLRWFQTEDIYPWYHAQRLLGYYATAVLLFGSVYFIIGRIRKNKESHKYSHHSDWLFIILLFLIALTGILIHIFRYFNMPLSTYYMYALHLAAYAPWVLIVIPFSKWTHLVFRPVAIYMESVRQSALRIQKEGDGA